MRRKQAGLAGVVAAALGIAGLSGCADTTSVDRLVDPKTALSASFASVPPGYGDLTSSYVGMRAELVGDSSMGPARDHAGPPRGEMMGGGMDDAFVGGVERGRGFGHEGPFGGGLRCPGTFDAATGRVTCDPVTLRNGFIVTRSAAYSDASGAVQSAFDSVTTNTVNMQVAVSGTLTFVPHDGPPPRDGGRGGPPPRRDGGPGGPGGPGGGGPGGPGGPGRPPRGGPNRLFGDTAHILSASSTIASSSDRTVTGLAQGSTQRTVNATSQGSEQTAGTSTAGEFTVTRSAADTVTGLVVPLGEATYPVAGRVARVMSATLTYSGKAPVSVSRKEVVTFDGSATATVTITENGVTRNCTRPLPRGPLTCS